MKIRTFIPALSVMLFIILSCGGNAVIQKNFIIQYENSIEQTNEPNLDCSGLPHIVRVERFDISRAYNQDRIALRTKSNELIYYYYNNWAENPASAVRYFIWEKIKSNNMFISTLLNDVGTIPDFTVTGAINQIERVDREDEHAAHIKMILEFTNQKSGETLVFHKFDRFSNINENASMNEFAREISKILDEECRIFLNKICSQLNENK